MPWNRSRPAIRFQKPRPKQPSGHCRTADKAIRPGLDTKFFVLFNQQHSLATSVWSAIGAGKRHAVVSGLTLYELHRFGLKGEIKPAYASQCLQSIPQACEVVWMDQLEQLTKSAQLGHGLGLSMADSITLSAFLTGDAAKSIPRI